jgi:spermidine/putrescine transport system permease protein
VLLPAVDRLQWSLMDAARDLGASRVAQWRHAWAPQLKTAWLTSFLLCFGVSFDDYLISTFVKGVDVTTLPVQLFSMLRVRVKDEVYAMSLILFCISIAVVLVSQWWKHRRQQRAAT